MEGNSKRLCEETKENQNNTYFIDKNLLIIVGKSKGSLIWNAGISKQYFFPQQTIFQDLQGIVVSF